MNTVTQPLEWNTALGLCTRLRNEGRLRDYLLILCGIHFGLRIGDLLSIRFSDVLNQESFVLKEKKTKKMRKITINPTVREGLKYTASELAKKNKLSTDSFLFSNRWGNKPISVSYVNKHLPKLLKKYKIRCDGNESSHLLRKTFGRAVWNAHSRSDEALIYLSDIFNHSNTKVTRRYLGIHDNTIRDIYISL